MWPIMAMDIVWHLLTGNGMITSTYWVKEEDKENEDEEFIGQPMKEIWEEPVKVSILV